MSSILETFYILFESNADDVKKGADEAGEATDKLEDKVKNTDKAVAKLGEGFRSMTKSAMATIAATIGVGAIVAGTIAQAQHIEMLRQTSERLNANIGDWHAWSRAVEQFGGDASTLEGTLRGLNANISEIALKGNSGISPFLAKLGVRVRKANGEMKSSLELLPELAEAFEGLSKQQVEGIGAKLGLDSGTILMLMQGRRAVEDYIQKQKELGVVTERQAKIAESYTKQVRNTRAAFQMLLTNISEFVLPILERFMRGLEVSVGWISKYSREILVFAGIMGIALAPVLFTAAKAAWAFAAGIWAAIAPFLPFIALGLALAVILGDIWAYFTGAPSAIGTMVDAFKSAVPAIKQAFKEWGEFAIGIIQNVLEWFRKIANIVTFGGFDKIVDAVNAGQKFMFTAQTSPLGAQSSAALIAGNSASNNNVTIGEVKIETQATDADGISKAIGNSLNDEMNRTLNANDDGIMG